MKKKVDNNNKKRVTRSRVVETVLHIAGYTLSFFIVSKMFNTFELSQKLPGLYAFIAVILIYLLNKTIKPILLFFTIPITALSLGSFYFVLNTLILKLVDWIMLDKLDFTNIWILFFISIMISLVNLLIELVLIKPIVKRVK